MVKPLASVTSPPETSLSQTPILEAQPARHQLQRSQSDSDLFINRKKPETLAAPSKTILPQMELTAKPGVLNSQILSSEIFSSPPPYVLNPVNSPAEHSASNASHISITMPEPESQIRTRAKKSEIGHTSSTSDSSEKRRILTGVKRFAGGRVEQTVTLAGLCFFTSGLTSILSCALRDRGCYKEDYASQGFNMLGGLLGIATGIIMSIKRYRKQPPHINEQV